MSGSGDKPGTILFLGFCAGLIILLLFFGSIASGHFQTLDETSHLPAIFKLWPAPTPTPSPGRLLISEVLYSPVGAEPEGEWIEIFNVGDFALDISSYKIGDEETQGEGEGMYAFPTGTTIGPQEVFIVAYSAATFEANYGTFPQFEIEPSEESVPDLVRYTSWAGGNMGLGNTGDEVLVLDGSDQLVDAVSWGNSVFAFDPSVPLVGDGHSLERYPAYQDQNEADDWREQSIPAPGQVDLTPPTPTPTLTPTSTPTATPVPPPLLVINEIHADPDPLNGDANGDGMVDMVEDEFIEIVNINGLAVDLSGWRIRDAIQIRHVFPDPTIIEHGCAVLIFGGGAPNGDFGGSEVQTTSTGSLGLSNYGDIIQLISPDGQVQYTYTYGEEGGEDQSLTRDPDISGPEPLIWHSMATGAGGSIFSPGTLVNGELFFGCSTAGSG